MGCEGWDGEGWDGRLNSAGWSAGESRRGGGGDGGPGPARPTSRANPPRNSDRGGSSRRPLGSRRVHSRSWRWTRGWYPWTILAWAAACSERRRTRSWRRSPAAVAAADALAPGLPAGRPTRCPCPRGGTVFSLVEWLVAMGLVWEYAEVTGNRVRTPTWGMLPLHASGRRVRAALLLQRRGSGGLVTAQGALTMAGNAGCVTPWTHRGRDRIRRTSDRGDAVLADGRSRKRRRGVVRVRRRRVRADVERGRRRNLRGEDRGVVLSRRDGGSRRESVGGTGVRRRGEAAWREGGSPRRWSRCPSRSMSLRFRQAGGRRRNSPSRVVVGVTMPVKVEEEQGVKEERERRRGRWRWPLGEGGDSPLHPFWRVSDRPGSSSSRQV